ncbi:MAG: hypothetical protein ACLRSW_13085 [Christensenellaceae bacterium]
MVRIRCVQRADSRVETPCRIAGGRRRSSPARFARLLIEAHGTARTAVLDYLGLGETSKRMVLSLIPETSERTVLEGIQKEMELYLVGKGICFTMPLTSVSSIVANGLLKAAPKEAAAGRERKMNENSRIYDLVIAAMQSGFADEAMNAAREAGAAAERSYFDAGQSADSLSGRFGRDGNLMILTKREGKRPSCGRFRRLRD